MALNELCRLTASAAVDLLKRREVSPLELIDAAAARIAETEPRLNAMPILCIDRARSHARRLMRETPVGPAAALSLRTADRGQRQRPCRGRALHDGFDDLRRPRVAGVRHRGAASGGVRRARRRQDEHSGVCGGRQHLQRGVRRHA